MSPTDPKRTLHGCLKSVERPPLGGQPNSRAFNAVLSNTQTIADDAFNAAGLQASWVEAWEQYAPQNCTRCGKAVILPSEPCSLT